MEFTKVIGDIDKDLVIKAQDKLSKVFLELGASYNNNGINPDLSGGDIFIFTLVYPAEHICTMSINTAATDGKRFYWNPKFVLKHTITGLRFLCTHEAGHAIYMHPARRASRNPKLWNIAVDYIVNGMVMEDCKARGKDPAALFTKHLGRFMTLNNYCKMLKDPFAKLAGFEDLDVSATMNSTSSAPRDPMKELTAQQRKDLDKEYRPSPFFFGDPDLADEMKSPEKIYALLFDLLPKCPDCGSLGMYKKPKESDKKDKGDKNKGDQPGGEKSEEKQDGKGEQPGDEEGGDQPGKDEGCCGSGGCSTCGGSGGDEYVDIFGLGGVLDDHIDTSESQEKLAKRIAEAMESAKRMAGHVPAAYEDELGQLCAPKMRWQDAIRGTLRRIKEGGKRNDWNRFKSRALFSGLMTPKRKTYTASFACLIDTSGSMSQDDMAYGISQLQSLDETHEGTITSCDSEIYWESTLKLRKCDKENLKKINIIGRGGTNICPFFDEYKDRLGHQDFIIMITDGYLSHHEMETMQDPLVPVFWLITSECDFKPSFGRVYNLHNM